MPTCDPIGVARTPIERPRDAPRQGSETAIVGRIELDSAYEPALEGMTIGRPYVVVWYAHLADRSTMRIDRHDGRGVFASRSQDRPNPICLTTCRLEAQVGRTLTVRGVDMVDGSPVLDLKPPLEHGPNRS